MSEQAILRFWSKVTKTDSCWEWTASKRHKGYGAFVWTDSAGNVVQGRAHRFSWMLHYGDIPAELCVLHRCDNPACVRPDHLFLGTKSENNADMRAKGRARAGGTKTPVDRCKYPRGEDHHGARLTESAVLGIRELRAAGVSVPSIAKRYGVGLSAVYRVLTGKTWKEVERADQL